MKVRRYSIVRRFAYLTGILLLVAYIVLGAVVYRWSLALLKRQIRSNALDIAATCAALIDAESFSKIYRGSEGSEIYLDVLHTLESFRDNAAVEYVYTVWYDMYHKPVFVVDSDPVDPAAIGEEHGEFDAVIKALKGTAAVTEEPVTDRWGTHFSAFAPIIHNGIVYGAVGVDLSYAWVQAEYRKLLILVITAGSLCFAISAFLLWRLNRRMQEKFLLLDSKLDDLMIGTDELRRVQGLHEGDEFEILADHINALFKKNVMAARQPDTQAKTVESALKVPEPGGIRESTVREEAAETQTGAGALKKHYDATGVLRYDEAIRLLGDDALLGKTVEQFYEDIDTNADELEALLARGDYENFTIRVHALKSSARMIGATALSGAAKRLEDLGNRAVET